MDSLEVCYWGRAFEGFKLALLWAWFSVLIWYHIKAAAMSPPAAMPSRSQWNVSSGQSDILNLSSLKLLFIFCHSGKKVVQSDFHDSNKHLRYINLLRRKGLFSSKIWSLQTMVGLLFLGLCKELYHGRIMV